MHRIWKILAIVLALVGSIPVNHPAETAPLGGGGIERKDIHFTQYCPDVWGLQREGIISHTYEDGSVVRRLPENCAYSMVLDEPKEFYFLPGFIYTMALLDGANVKHAVQTIPLNYFKPAEKVINFTMRPILSVDPGRLNNPGCTVYWEESKSGQQYEYRHADGYPDREPCRYEGDLLKPNPRTAPGSSGYGTQPWLDMFVSFDHPVYQNEFWQPGGSSWQGPGKEDGSWTYSTYVPRTVFHIFQAPLGGRLTVSKIVWNGNTPSHIETTLIPSGQIVVSEGASWTP